MQNTEPATAIQAARLDMFLIIRKAAGFPPAAVFLFRYAPAQYGAEQELEKLQAIKTDAPEVSSPVLDPNI